MKTNKRPKKLRSRTSTMVPVAVALMCLSGGMVYMAMKKTNPPLAVTKEPPQVLSTEDTVVVPTPERPIARGEKLSDVKFSYTKWPKSKLTGDYVIDINSFGDAVALAQLPEYLPIPVSAVSKGAIDMNAVVEGIPEGMRAITVRVDAESAVEGWARSGNFVDVILIRGGNDGLEAKVIAENVRILSAERQAKPVNSGATAPEAPRTVTLLTTQEDALKIKASSNIGKLTFALRGEGDAEPTAITGLSQKNLLGEAPNTRAVSDLVKGYAKDSTGKVYLLNDKSRWLRAADAEKSPFAAVSKPETNSAEKSNTVQNNTEKSNIEKPAHEASALNTLSRAQLEQDKIKASEAKSDERNTIN
ncbi:Flp pilus assembly protein CpaB [bacterium]|nr:Flp pilus assembly protein CpaB [bacterium]